MGDISDSKSKITPFKIIKGKLPFDERNNTLIAAKMNGEKGFLKTGNWNSSAEIGLKEMNQNFSGKVNFIETESYVYVNHMVSPKENALKYTQCHGVKGEKILNWKELGYPMIQCKQKEEEK